MEFIVCEKVISAKEENIIRGIGTVLKAISFDRVAPKKVPFDQRNEGMERRCYTNWWGDRHSRPREQLCAKALRQEQEGLCRSRSRMNEGNSSRTWSYKEARSCKLL